MSSRGQTFMPDFMASFLVFSVVIVFFFFAWNSIIQSQSRFTEEENMMRKARYTTTFLVSTPGYPENWEETGDVSIPGFASPDHLVQYEKLEAFDSLSYSKQREALLARNFYLSLRNGSSIIQFNGEELEFGKNYSGAETVIPFRRTVRLNLSGKISTATLKYVVWR